MSERFTEYIQDTLTSAIAQSEDCADFIVRQDDDLVYVDVEDGSLWLITIRKAEAHAAASPLKEEK